MRIPSQATHLLSLLASEKTARWRRSLPLSWQQMGSRSAWGPCKHSVPVNSVPWAVRVYSDLFAYSLGIFYELEVCHFVHTEWIGSSLSNCCSSLILRRGSQVNCFVPSSRKGGSFVLISCHQSLCQCKCLIFQMLDILFQKKTSHLDSSGSSCFTMTELNLIKYPG